MLSTCPLYFPHCRSSAHTYYQENGSRMEVKRDVVARREQTTKYLTVRG